METTHPLRKTLAQFLQTKPQPQPPTPTRPTSPIEPGNQPLDSLLQIEQPLALPNAQPQKQNNFDFSALVIAFCLTSAVDIAIQNHTVHPQIFHLFCLMVVFAFTSIFIAKCIAPRHPNAACKLESVGVFFGVTAFFFAVTISFPLCLAIISWIIYGLLLLAILICNCPTPLFRK